MKHEIIIVNELDKVVEYKEREKIISKDIYRVAVLWITTSKGELLLAKRSKTKKNDPGKWGPSVAGTVEKGETYYTNIIKEAKEEIGLIDTYPVKGDKHRVKGKRNYFSQWYFLTTNKNLADFKIDKSEVSEIKWFKKEELEKKIKSSPSQFSDSVKLLLKK
jgi:isopentenyldiphosphate isomerase